MGFLSDMADPQRNLPDATTPKRKRRYSYDQACADLAFYFLTDGKRDIDMDSEPVKELAQAIQDVCENHCRDFERG